MNDVHTGIILFKAPRNPVFNVLAFVAVEVLGGAEASLDSTTIGWTSSYILDRGTSEETWPDVGATDLTCTPLDVFSLPGLISAIGNTD